MAAFPIHQLAFAFGLLGNIVSFLVFLAPLPTFHRIFRKKSTEGFQSIPYSVALFSAMLMLYYAFLKTNALFLITINSIGCFIETIYLIIYMIYATKSAKIYTAKLLLLFNFGAFGLIILVTFFVWKGAQRVAIVGWICAVFSLCVFAAPLSIMRRVIKTKSVEYMPFSLSFFLTLCAVMWFFYGLLLKDYYIATPNILGFTFGIAQMMLYGIYKDSNKKVLPESKLRDLEKDGFQVSKLEVQGNLVKSIEAKDVEALPESKQQIELSYDSQMCVVEIPEGQKKNGVVEKVALQRSESNV